MAVSEFSTAQAAPGSVGSTVIGSSVFVEPTGIGGVRASGATLGVGGFFYEPQSAAFSSGFTLTYTLAGGSGPDVAISAFYATGLSTLVDPYLSTLSAGKSTSGTAPSITSPAPDQSGYLFIGGVTGSSISSFTQDTSTSWSGSPSTVSRVGAGIAGGAIVHTSTAAVTYAPTVTSGNFREWLVAFKPAPFAGALSADPGRFIQTGEDVTSLMFKKHLPPHLI